MAAPRNELGFAPPRREKARRRRAAAVELIATFSLTLSLAIALTAVSLGNRALSRGDGGDKPSLQTPIGALLDQPNNWLAWPTLQ